MSPGAADDEVTPDEVAEAVDEIAGEISAQIAELDPDAQLAVVLQACARLGAQQREVVGNALLALDDVTRRTAAVRTVRDVR